MRLVPRFLRPALCIAQSLFLMAPLPVLAATTSSDSARLAAYERTLYGQAHSSLSVEARLRAIETNLFGSPRSGSTEARLQRIDGILAGKRGSVLMPPLAPQLDTSSPQASSTGSSSPANDSGYSQSDSSSYAASDTKSEQLKDLLRKAIQLHSAGKTADAEKAFRRVLAMDYRNVDANFSLGAIEEERGDLDNALKHYQAALSGSPEDTEIQQAVSAVQSKLRDRQTAQARQQEVAQQQRQHDQLKKMSDEAASAFRSGNYDQAIRDLNMVAAQAPDDPDVNYALAQAWRGKGNLQQARSYMSQAVKSDPENQQYRNALADLDKQMTASSQSSDPEAYDSTPAGQITPMAPERGWSGSRSAGSGLGSIGSMLPGVALGGLAVGLGSGLGGGYYGGGYHASSGTRLRRVAAGSLAGAAIGALLGSRSGNVKGGAVRGALYGGLTGLIFGGL